MEKKKRAAQGKCFCKRCKREITGCPVNTKYCPECAIISARESRAESARKARAKGRIAVKSQPKYVPHDNGLTALIAAADAAGMSYGKYVAMLSKKT